MGVLLEESVEMSTSSFSGAVGGCSAEVLEGDRESEYCSAIAVSKAGAAERRRRVQAARRRKKNQKNTGATDWDFLLLSRVNSTSFYYLSPTWGSFLKLLLNPSLHACCDYSSTNIKYIITFFAWFACIFRKMDKNWTCELVTSCPSKEFYYRQCHKPKKRGHLQELYQKLFSYSKINLCWLCNEVRNPTPIEYAVSSQDTNCTCQDDRHPRGDLKWSPPYGKRKWGRRRVTWRST